MHNRVQKWGNHFGLSSTNMLIHGDWNSNVIQDSMFNRWDWIQEKNINIVLMNPPYNATRKCCNPEYVKTRNSKTTEDPSKWFHFLEYVSNVEALNFISVEWSK